METDEQSIRALIDTWLTASRAGDLETLLSLMADDVVFMVPGKEPFGKEAFASAFRSGVRNMDVTGTSQIQEIEVLGNWAWMRNRLEITMTPAGGARKTQRLYAHHSAQRSDRSLSAGARRQFVNSGTFSEANRLPMP